MRVATMPAKTMEGLIAKIALIACPDTSKTTLTELADGILAEAPRLDVQALVANVRLEEARAHERPAHRRVAGRA